MAEVPDGWEKVVASLEPHVSPTWMKYARDHGGQPWVRLIALVDAHAQLSNPGIPEKIAMTMEDLAAEREGERRGWQALREKTAGERMETVAALVDAAPQLLPEDLVALFVRSVDPMGAINAGL